MRRTMLAVTVIAALALLATNAFAAGGLKLRYKSSKGETHEYALAMKMESSTQMMGQEMQQKMLTEARLKVVTEDVKQNGDIIFISSMDSLKLEIHALPMTDTSFTNPPGLIGKRSRVTFSNTGRELSREQVDSIQMTGPFAGAALRTSSFLVPLDAREVGIGDSLVVEKVDTTAGKEGNMVTTTTVHYFVAGKENKEGHECVKLPYTMTVKLTGTGSQMGQQFAIDGEGRGTGTVYFDVDKGLLVSSQRTMDMETTYAMTGDQKMVIPSSQTVESTITLAK